MVFDFDERACEKSERACEKSEFAFEKSENACEKSEDAFEKPENAFEKSERACKKSERAFKKSERAGDRSTMVFNHAGAFTALYSQAIPNVSGVTSIEEKRAESCINFTKSSPLGKRFADVCR